jgi:apolipoprotein N-acyltransferase
MNVLRVAVLSENDETKPASRALVAAPRFQPIDWRWAGLLAVIAVACFHAAYAPAQSRLLAFGIVGYVICLIQLARLRTTRQCFYTTLVVGYACVAPQLECFWRIFGAFAIALWLLLALWIAFFVVLTHLAIVRLGLKRAALLAPFFWTGLEYFRSELYYLKFSWLNVGYAFAESSIVPLASLGVYGVGFGVAAWSSLFLTFSARRIWICTFVTLAALIVIPFLFLPTAKTKRPLPNLRVAGVQLEFPNSCDITRALDRVVVKDNELVANHIGSRPLTNINLLVLSEYTLDGEPSNELKDWCRTNQKFLIVGGKDGSPGTNFYNTAFVIGTNGNVIFKQVKRVPIQFFKDGLPAPEQKLWDSPWGKVGICICYDLCYTRVTDELVRQGAQMIIAPTMDVADWGRHQHELHARVAPVRAAEHGIPIFRLASSGISQGVNRSGQVQASAPFPGEGEMIFFGSHLDAKGSLPFDRWFAPACVAVTAVFVVWVLVETRKRKHHSSSPAIPAA